MAKFMRLYTDGRGGSEIMVNVDEISSCHIEGGFSYTDYILILKCGTIYRLDSESYRKVMELISE